MEESTMIRSTAQPEDVSGSTGNNDEEGSQIIDEAQVNCVDDEEPESTSKKLLDLSQLCDANFCSQQECNPTEILQAIFPRREDSSSTLTDQKAQEPAVSPTKRGRFLVWPVGLGADNSSNTPASTTAA